MPYAPATLFRTPKRVIRVAPEGATGQQGLIEFHDQARGLAELEVHPAERVEHRGGAQPGRHGVVSVSRSCRPLSLASLGAVAEVSLSEVETSDERGEDKRCCWTCGTRVCRVPKGVMSGPNCSSARQLPVNAGRRAVHGQPFFSLCSSRSSLTDCF